LKHKRYSLKLHRRRPCSPFPGVARASARTRKKKPSRTFREQFGHTPVSPEEAIPWGCKRLVIGTGMEGRLPVMDEVAAEARRRGVELVTCPTPEAVQLLWENPADTNAILHVTC